MKMTPKNINIADYYFELLKHLSSDSKLELINRLSNSLKSKSESKKKNDLKASFGAFITDQTAEEIIADIRSSRTFNREIADL
ncbi:hypothetical protein ACFSJU_01565 [Paradesertivirga mongoliensis]|uniref:Antitoxin n=1 Tax=Paradesertivirga mongoliensis TaxID=2100740 RepID=A0ABW4ZHR7_9SPHI|nr:hypothetical protein [Pedobacter mongoliensis]